MITDTTLTVHIHTPGGLIVEYSEECWPDVFRSRMNDDSTENLKNTVAYLSRLTGCRCSIESKTQITCDANDQTYPNSRS